LQRASRMPRSAPERDVNIPRICLDWSRAPGCTALSGNTDATRRCALFLARFP